MVVDDVVVVKSVRKFRWLRALLFAFGVVTVMSWSAAIGLQPEAVGPPGAPAPAQFSDPVIQVYGADVWGWRGRFAIHTWVAMKPRDAKAYTLYQAIGWRLRRGPSVVSIAPGQPDRHWFGSEPILLADLRGEGVDELIERVEKAAHDYPFAGQYSMWPGPNSNSFTAWIGLEVPELNLKLPFKALGKRWMETNYEGIKAERRSR